ncbi:hypothetical protein [Alkaliphilus metalliredigens]|nr:hypothetical protein [Alkaliphilus metalliredigens]
MIEYEYLTDQIVVDMYEEIEESKIKIVENRFLGTVVENRDQFVDWLVYDYQWGAGGAYARGYLTSHREKLTEEEQKYIQNGLTSFLGLYEVTQMNDDEVTLKNIFTYEDFNMDKKWFQENVALYALVVARVVHGEGKPQFLNNRVFALPYQYKNILVGEILEVFELAKKSKPYLTYDLFLKSYLPEVIGKVDKMANYGETKEGLDLYQSIYIILDVKLVQKLFRESSFVQLEDDDSAEQIFSIVGEGEALAEIIVKGNHMEVECNSEEARNHIKSLLEDLAKPHLQHVKDEILSIDDLL